MEELALGPLVDQHSEQFVEDLVGSSHALLESAHLDHPQRLFVLRLSQTVPEGSVRKAPEVYLVLGLPVPVLPLLFEGEVVVIVEQVLVELACF